MAGTIIINGSPNGKNGNTEIFIREFSKGMEAPPEVRYAAKEAPRELAEYLSGFSCIIVFMPLYVHAMPGRVMKLMEHMKPANPGQKLGFVVQQGFVESSNSDYLAPYLELFARKLGYAYMGLVVRGYSAGIRYMPDMANKALFGQLQSLGKGFEASGGFDEAISRKMAEPYRLSRVRIRLYKATSVLRMSNIFWNTMMKRQKAFDARFDKPFKATES